MSTPKSDFFTKLKSFILGPEENDNNTTTSENTSDLGFDEPILEHKKIEAKPEELIEKKLNPKLDDTLKPMAVKKVVGYEDAHTPVFTPPVLPKQEINIDPNLELDVLFAENFTAAGGKFIFADTKEEFVEILKQLKSQFRWKNIYYWEDEIKEILDGHDTLKISIGCTLEKSQSAISLCEYIIANDGSIMLSSKQASTRGLSVFPDAHIILADSSRLVYNLEAGVKKFNKEHGSELPFLIYLSEKASAENKSITQLILNATGTKNIFIVFVDEKIYKA
jgi:L-lactate dehydrogenase complex protein LldG